MSHFSFRFWQISGFTFMLIIQQLAEYHINLYVVRNKEIDRAIIGKNKIPVARSVGQRV